MPDTTLILHPDPGIPEFLIGQVQAKLAYLDESVEKAIISPDGTSLTLFLDSELPDSRRQEIKAKANHVLDAMVSGALKPRIKVLEDHLDRTVPYRKDPMPWLLEHGEVYEESPGMFSIGPLLTRLIAYFEGQLVDLAKTFDARPYRFPALISAKFLEQIDYFHSFPHSLTFASHLRQDLDLIERFSNEAHCSDEGLEVPPNSFAKVRALLSTAVCFHLYEALNHSKLKEPLCATAVGRCFRYEASNLSSLTRLWDFTMYEIIFVGPKDFVLENRETAGQRASKLYESWGLAYKVESANDPFFVGEFKKQAAFQSAFQLKYEVQAQLPYRENRLAIGSYNYHQDFFGRRMHISMPDESFANTGCIAFGLERLAFAFLAQYGFDQTVWPQAVREGVSCGI